MRARKRLFVIAAVIFVVAAPLLGKVIQETTNRPDDGLLNLPSAPLKISRSGGNFLKVKNVSPGQVIRYRIGCVLLDRNRVKILSKRSESVIELDPADIHFFGAFHKEAEYCKPSEAKLTVLEAYFADGGMWKIRLP